MTAGDGRADRDDATADGPSRVRPYALVDGRTRTLGVPLAVEAIIVTTDEGRRTRRPLEQGRILRCAAAPTSVAEVAALLRVPVGVVRVLVSDLAAAELVQVHLPLVDLDVEAPPTRDVLERCLAGLHAL